MGSFGLGSVSGQAALPTESVALVICFCGEMEAAWGSSFLFIGFVVWSIRVGVASTDCTNLSFVLRSTVRLHLGDEVIS